MGNAKRRADRIRAEVPIIRILADYGYQVDPSGGDREQQFSCNLHGDGRDSKPSARVYPRSASFYCFACGRTRDGITLVREREGIDFNKACSVIEQRYGLPPLPWEPDEPVERPTDEVRKALNTTRTFEQERTRVERLITLATEEREHPLDRILAFWEAFDRICYGVEREDWGEERGKMALLKLRDHIIIGEEAA